MHDRVKRWALGCGCLAGSLLIWGCSDPATTADREVDKYLAKAQSTTEPTQSEPAYEQAARVNDASPAQRAVAKSLQGQNLVQIAGGITNQFDRKLVDANRLAWEISHLAQSVHGVTDMIDAWQTTDPTSAKTTLQKDRDVAAGGAGKDVWLDFGRASVPTLAKLDADGATLKQALDQNTAHKADLTDQRSKILAQADTLEVQSQGETGQQSVDDYKKAADLRKQAAYIVADIDGVDAEHAKLTAESNLNAAQRQIVADAIKDIDGEIAQLDMGWKDQQTQIDKARQLRGQLYTGNPDTATISSDTAALLAETADTDQLFTDAESRLTEALQQFEGAAGQATQFSSALRNRISTLPPTNSPETPVDRILLDVVNPNVYRLQQARTEHLLGRLYASQAASYGLRQQMVTELTPILQKAGMPLPPGLDHDFSADQSATLKKALDQYTDADQKLTDITTSPMARAQDMKAGAAAERILLLCDWAAIDPSGNHIADARTVHDNMQTADLSLLPTIPMALAAVLPLPTTQPIPDATATQPAPAPDATSAPAVPDATAAPAAPTTPAAPATPAAP